MHDPPLIGDVTRLKPFEPAIKLQALSADLSNPYFRDYILTQDLAEAFRKVLSSVVGDGWGSLASALPAERLRSHLISAQYGAGKSYFLMILSALLDAAGDPVRLATARDKFQAFRFMQGLLRQLEDKRFLIVQLSAEDKGDVRFKELVVSSLLREVNRALPNVAFTSEYSEAIEQLQHLEEREPAVKARFAQALEDRSGASVQQLQARLASYDREGLHLYYDTWERVLGRAVSRERMELGVAFDEALDLLKPKGYTHIAVILDELTAYLKASKGHHSLEETIGEMQSFAAHCNKPASRCLFVGAIHISVQEFLQEVSQQRDYEKMKGRFDEYDFPLYSSKLLAGVFQPDKAAFDQAVRRYRAQVDQLAELIKTFGMTEGGRPLEVSALFPLHPAAAHYLPRISRELGQAERTSFGFLNEVVRSKLAEPLAVDDRLNLVTLDELFDYFTPAMEQRPHYQQVITAYNTVQTKVANPLAHRAFKPLALLWVASRVRSEEAQYLEIDLSAEQMADYLGVPDDLAVTESLGSLCETRYVYLDRSTDKYFYSHADPDWDLESEIQKGTAGVNANEVLHAELRGLGGQICLDVPAKVTVKVERSLESEWVNLRKLEETSSLKPRRYEAKVVFVVPDLVDAERYPAAFSDVVQKARSLSARNAAVAVPKRLDMLKPDELRRYRALQIVGQRLGAGDQATVQEHRVRQTRARFSEVRERVQRDLLAFGHPSNYLFFVDRQAREARDLDTVLTDMFERYYYKFPKVKVESINGRSTTNALIEQCIVNPHQTFAGDSSEVARQTRDTLQVLGLCSWQEGAGGKIQVELKEPQPGTEGYEIWRMVVDGLTGDSETPFEDLYRRLAEAPYGLPSYLVELYIAAARALGKVLILDHANKMPAVSKSLVAEITKHKDKKYRVLAVERSEVPYVYICSVWKAVDEALGLRYYQELEKNLGRTVDDQSTWFDLKQDTNNLLQNLLDPIREKLEALQMVSQPFVSLHHHMEQAKSEIVAAQGFKILADLGTALSGREVSADPDGAASAVRQAIEASKQFLDDYAPLEAGWRMFRTLRNTVPMERFGTTAAAAAKSWEAYSQDALSAKKRNDFLNGFQALWASYAEIYVSEHNALAHARARYGKRVTESIEYALLGEFDALAFPGVATQAGFEANIQTERAKSCQPLVGSIVEDYQQYGRTVCSSCNYRLGGLDAELQQLQQGEASLAANVKNALEFCLVKLGASLQSESLQLYEREKASTEEKSVTGALRLVANRQERRAEDVRQTLKTQLPRLVPILQAAETYVREQARQREELRKQWEEEERRRRIPRVPTARLADRVREFLADSGLEAMTLEELRQRLNRWLTEIAREFKPPM